jgi:hypothetical protein
MSTSTSAAPAHALPGKPSKPIDNLDDLARHLWMAAKVELSTIPLYLYSAYSIKIKGYSQWAPQRGALRTLIGIAIEEMLHLCLVRNLMVAIGRGGEIKFYDENFIPQYPSNMLNRYPDLPLNLRRLSNEQLDTFIELEAPDDLLNECALHPKDSKQYTSLGAFYHRLEEGFENLTKKDRHMWDNPQIEKQYLRGFWNEFGTGKPLRVCNLDTAKQALNIIVEQGEGSVASRESAPRDPNHPTRNDDVHTHFHKFVRLREGVEGIGAVDGSAGTDILIDDPRATWPLVSNPKVENYKQYENIHALMQLFNAAYCYTLCVLDEVYQNKTTDVRKELVPEIGRVEQRSKRYGLERNGIAAMQGILYPIAELLVRTPIPAGSGPDKGRNAAPPFQYHRFEGGSKKQQLLSLCRTAAKHFPELGGDDGVERQISLITEV